MTPLALNVSIFDIHFILLAITSYLTPREIEICRSVSKSWRSGFYTFRRIQAHWRPCLTLTDQNQLLSQCTNIWTLSIPLDDPSFHPLIKSGRLRNVRELTCLGRGTCKELHGARWRLASSGSDWDAVDSNVYYDLPWAVEELLRTAIRLIFLKIEYEDVAHLTSHQQFSGSMLHALRQHQTLSTLLLDFPHGLDWPGVRAALHSLPDTIERLEINGSSQRALLYAAQPLETLVRIEPYLRLRQLHFGKEFGKRQVLTGLLPFLQLCPHLQEFRLDLTRLSPSLEKIIADKLLEYCPDINDLDLRFWETNEQMRLIQGYSFKTLRVCDFILRDPTSIGGVPPRGPSTTFRPSDDRPRTIPFLALSTDTLEVLELESTHCWTPYHDLDLVMNQFPNLKELTMDLFEFRPQDRGHQQPTIGSMSTKIEKLTLVIHERPTDQQNQDAIDFCSMVSLPPLAQGAQEDDGEHYDRRDEWSFRDLFGILELDVPPTTRQSSVTLADGILQLYDRLALFKHLQDVQLIWYIYRAPDAVWDFDGNLDVRGPLQIELERQGLNRAALQKMNLKWTQYPVHDEDKAQEVDAKLREQGFVLTDMEAGPRRNRVYGEHVSAQRRGMTMMTKSADIEHESDDDGGETEIVCGLYKSRNRRRTELARRLRSRHRK